MKDLGNGAYVLGIQIIRDRKNKVLSHFLMQNAHGALLPMLSGIFLSKEQCPKIPQDEEDMRRVPYASAVGSLMYAMLCTKPNICYAVGIVSRYR